jgi:hypothetical protein
MLQQHVFGAMRFERALEVRAQKKRGFSRIGYRPNPAAQKIRLGEPRPFFWKIHPADDFAHNPGRDIFGNIESIDILSFEIAPLQSAKTGAH